MLGSIMRKRIFILIAFIFVGNLFAQSEIIEHSEIKKYTPVKHGLKDLIFRVDIPGLAESLNARKSLGTITEAYFNVFWALPGKFQVDVIGLPNGFYELKVQLRNLIVPHLKIIFPDKLSNTLRSYSLSKHSSNGESSLKAIDKTGTKAINTIDMQFSKEGYLKNVKTYSPAGSQNTELLMSKKTWSHNKWVLMKSITSSEKGPQKVSSITEIDYEVVSGYGLPKEVKVISRIELIKGIKPAKGYKPFVKEEKLFFSDFQVNTGKALKRFLVNKKEKNDKK